MRIAILGASSQIAKDLIISFSLNRNNTMHLFARRPKDVTAWMKCISLAGNYQVDDFSVFGTQEFDAIINFVGTGNPSKTAEMGSAIFDVTLQFDELALRYIRQHPACRYIFLSSGAAYGSNFNLHVGIGSKAAIAINDLQPNDWYGVAKLHAECRHRSFPHLPIVDIRIFNYFSHTQDMDARFLITDIVRSIRDKSIFKTSAETIERDFIGPQDFYQLVRLILNSPATNLPVDCYSKSPVDKINLLKAMQEHFGLQYKLVKTSTGVNATGNKPHYYSTNKRAEHFGYKPSFTSLENVTREVKFVMDDISSSRK
jgi:nucleoside-diphosphate-sugar epimerase